MLDPAGNFPARVATASAALSILVLATSAAWPQAAPPSLGIQSPAQQSIPERPQPQQAAPQQNELAPPPSPENPGLINELGKLWDKSKAILPTIKTPQEAIEDLNARARETVKETSKDTGEGLSRLAKPSLMVTGRMGCPVSANGAPDCKAGADKLCQSKGYQEGKSLDTDAAEKCSAKVYLPGRKREPGDCRTENYVTRALCQ